MRSLWENPCVALLAATMFFSPALSVRAGLHDLIHRYQRETSEFAKRDLALKMIDTGVLRLHGTTRRDIARIFGSDWHMFSDDPGESRPYGIVHFARQLEAPKTGPPIQVPYIGWYMVVYFSPKTYVVVDWHLSNKHK